MSFRIIVRGSPTRISIEDFECPNCGRFEAEVPRINGEPPDWITCPKCHAPSEYRICAPMARVRRVEAIKGKWEKPERKEWLDVSNLAEGQLLYEFREDRERIREEERKREVYEFARAHHESVIGIDD
jgi:hypothetical protein